MDSKRKKENKKQKTKKFFLMVTNFNEEKSIGEVLDRVPMDLIDGAFVVDGGSTDKSTEIAREKGFEVIQQEGGRGKGKAFSTAIKHIPKDYDYVVILAADGNERAEEIRKLASKIEEGYDFVLATRFGAGKSEDVTPIRWIGNWGLTLIASIIIKKWVTDAQNSLRIVRRDAFEKMNVESKRFDIEAEMLIKASKLGLRIAEVPTIEDKRVSGNPQLQTLKDGWIIFKRMMKEAFRNPPY
jgi:glycosyltransferase involved in cell wall biosynthesis